jgi:hypothetical protein
MNRSTVLPGGTPAYFNPESQGLVAGPTQLQLHQAMQQQAAKAGALAPTAQNQAIAGAAGAMRAQQSQAAQVLEKHKVAVLALSGGQLPGYQGVLAMGAPSADAIAAAIGM